MALQTVREHYQKFRVRLALKAAFGAVLCACISNLFHLPTGYLSSLIVALVLVVFHGQTLRAGVPAMIGIVAAGSMQVWITMILSDSGFAYGLCSLLWLFLWMAFLSALPLAHMLGGILIAMVLFNFALGTAEVRTLVQAFWLQCAIGITIATGLDRLLWPSKVEDAYMEALASLLESFARDIETIIAGIPSDESADTNPTVHATEIRHIAHLASLSGGTLQRDNGARIRLNFSCRLIWERIRLANQFIAGKGSAILTPEQRVAFHSIFEGLAQHYRSVAEAVILHRPASDVDPETRRAISVLTEGLRRSGPRPASLDGTAPVVRLLEHGLADHERVVADYNEIFADISGRQRRDGILVSILRQVFVWPHAVTFKGAARIALIILALFVVVVYLGFPGSSLVAFYGVAFGLTANIGQLYMKGQSGAAGVLGGIAVGLAGVLLLTQCPHFPIMIGLFGIAMFLAAYASSAPEPIGFAGLQAALVTPYMFVFYEGPRWTVEDAATRACALVVSAAIAVAVQRLAWQVDPLVMFRTVISQALETIATGWERLQRNERRIPKRSALADAFDLSADLLRDSRYVIGSSHPLAHAYLGLLRSLQDMFASMQAMAQLRMLERDDPIVVDAFERIAPAFENVSQILNALSVHVGQKGSAALEHLSALLADLQEDAARLEQECEPDMQEESRRPIMVLSSLVREITNSLSNAVSAALEIPS